MRFVLCCYWGVFHFIPECTGAFFPQYLTITKEAATTKLLAQSTCGDVNFPFFGVHFQEWNGQAVDWVRVYVQREDQTLFQVYEDLISRRNPNVWPY